MPPIRLVIADRRPIVLQGFASMFAAERDFAVVASCLDGAGCLEAVRKLAPDLVLVEDGFCDVTASDMLAVVKAEHIPTRLVFYTASVTDGDLAAAIAAGACCAISMRKQPEALIQSLRLLAPLPDHATAPGQGTGALGQNGLGALTDQDRKIMRLVACGMSNRQIARQLKMSADTIKARLDHISTQLEIKNRTEVTAFALSRLFGGLGALAALIFAALDDAKAADTIAFDDEPTDTFTVMAANGAAITIKIKAEKTTVASGKTAKAIFKADRVENPITETPGRASKLIPSGIDIGLGSIMPAPNAARPGLGSYGTLMIAAAGVWIYELLDGAAHASNLGDSLAAFASVAGNGTGELAALSSPGGADANLGSLHDLAWLHPETYDQSFAFAVAGSEIIAGTGDDLHIIGADASGDSGSSNGNPHVGSGAITALLDQDGFAQAAASDASGNLQDDRMHATAGEESNPGQSQHDLQIAEDDGPAAKQHDEHGSSEDGSTNGQSQRALQDSEDGTGVATQHSRHDLPGGDSEHAQSPRDLSASEDRSAAAEQHARDDATLAGGANSSQSQRESHEFSVKASGHAGSSQHAGEKDQTPGDSGQAQKAAAPELGDSFHFRNDIAASNASHSSGVHGGHGPYSMDYGLHTVEHGALTALLLIGPSHPEQSAVDHATGAEHHLTHDLFV